ALEYFGRAVDAARQVQNPLAASVNLASVASLQAAQGDFSNAGRELTDALETARKSNVPVAESQVDRVLSDAPALGKDIPAAIRYQNDALEALRLIQNLSGQASALTRLGDLYLARGDQRRALDYLLRGLSVSEAINDTVTESVTLASLMRYWRTARQT